MSTALVVLSDITVVLGALVFATAALGLTRFPDSYTRISAVGTAGGIGIVLVVVGALLRDVDLPDTLKVVAIVVLQLVTSAVGSMALARSAHLSGSPLRRARYDELTDDRTDAPES